MKVLVTNVFRTSELHTTFQSDEEGKEEYALVFDIVEMLTTGHEINFLQYQSRMHDSEWKRVLVSKFEGTKSRDLLAST